MRIRYSRTLKEIELDNEGFMIIPLKKDAVGFEIDKTMFDFKDDTNIRINFKNFMVNGKPTFKYKLKTIWWIIKMK